MDESSWYEGVDAEQKKSWIRRDQIMYGGLIGVGVVIIQPFLTATSLGFAAFITVIAFAVALPLLGITVILYDQADPSGSYPASVGLPAIAKWVGLGGACLGVVAALWHIHWIAGLVVLVSGAAAVTVLAVGAAGATPQAGSAGPGGSVADADA